MRDIGRLFAAAALSALTACGSESRLAVNPATSSVGGTITGLDRGGLVLSSPGLADLTVAPAATVFRFVNRLPAGARYDVTVTGQPRGLVCKVAGGTGTVTGADVTSVAIACSQAWVAITSARSNRILGLKSDGSLWAWGRNMVGEVGDGTTSDRYLPTPIGAPTGWVKVVSSAQFAIAQRADGSLWAWGWNGAAHFGDGTYADSLVPKATGNGLDWIDFAAGFNHVVAVKRDGSLWGWGWNQSGQVGDGTTTPRTSPVRIGTDSDWRAVGAGDLSSFAIKADGSLWAWGDNSSGQLGDTTTTTRSSPVQVGADRDWKAASGSATHTVAMKVGGSIWGWGSNSSAQLGDATLPAQLAPVRIGSAASWRTIEAVGPLGGSGSSLALESGGTIWGWGSNFWGQLGTGGRSAALPPTQIGSRTDWTWIAGSGACTFAVSSAGDAWAWGKDCLGPKPDGTISSYPAGVEIIAPAQ